MFKLKVLKFRDDDDAEGGAKTPWRPLMDVLLLDILFLDDVINAARTKARDASPRRSDDDIIPIVDIVIINVVVLLLLFLFFLLFV